MDETEGKDSPDAWDWKGRLFWLIILSIVTACGIGMLINPDPEFLEVQSSRPSNSRNENESKLFFIALWLLWCRPTGIFLLICCSGIWALTILIGFLKYFGRGLVLELPQIDEDVGSKK